ncbi:hypothetical protein M6D81_11595 [Paenibacillus sp. J5C_2022]|uniref:hypothetical protein n=1 Tax=Paenibacillus sp. J5C2022 TaxID=2977129 RepID=UPI0021D301A7|nr:hypothetical protein [Paenibacillus sp. J5C2022]MCU6709351.1 hypothetical protein [Paenibacillus sp. J5C2022]
MAKYKASPGYVVAVGNKTVRFDYHGECKTDDAAEIKILDGLVPKWVTKVSDGNKPEVSKAEMEPKPAPAETQKPAPTRSRRTSGK